MHKKLITGWLGIDMQHILVPCISNYVSVKFHSTLTLLVLSFYSLCKQPSRWQDLSSSEAARLSISSPCFFPFVTLLSSCLYVRYLTRCLYVIYDLYNNPKGLGNFWIWPWTHNKCQNLALNGSFPKTSFCSYCLSHFSNSIK